MPRRSWDHGGKTAHARGYGVAWQKLRRRILLLEPLCRICASQGRTTAATQVDHVVPKVDGGTDDEENLQPLCSPCHDAKTRSDKGARPRGCDANGLPLDASHHWRRPRP